MKTTAIKTASEISNENTAKTNATLVQPKLSVSQPDDKYEKEADAVADKVMRMPEQNFIQRKCAHCEEEEKKQVQRKPTSQNITINIQAKGETGTSVSNSISNKINAYQGNGSSMDGNTQSFMESRFGTDFNDVKIHTDGEAIQMNCELNAKAFTTGNDIYFNEGQYQPNSDSGKQLLAHELTHTVQQESYGSSIMPYRPKDSVNFGTNDGSGLSEETFNDSKTQPFIEKITVLFNGTKKIKDDSGVDEDVPTGTLSATYSSKAAAFSKKITSIPVVGGFPKAGLTDKDTDMDVKRIEGWGYHHLAVPKSGRVGKDWPKSKYFKPSLAAANATMSYALFFRGKEAIHFGPDDHGSLACVHVSDMDVMRQLNYHSRLNKTKVDVDYTSSVLSTACCQRYSEMGYMVSNPCGKEDKSKCP